MPAVSWPALGTTLSYSTNGTTYTPLGQLMSLSHGGGGEVGERDTTTLSSTAKTVLPTIVDNGEVSFDLNWDPTDVGHQQLRSWKESPPTSLPFWKITWPTTTPTTVVFNGFVKGLDGPNAGGVDESLTMTVTVRVSGNVTYT